MDDQAIEDSEDEQADSLSGDDQDSKESSATDSEDDTMANQMEIEDCAVSSDEQSSCTQPARKKLRTVRTRWPLGDGNNGEDTVLVSSNVAIAAAGDDESSDDHDDEDDEDSNRNHRSNNVGIGRQPPGGLLAGASPSNQESHDGAGRRPSTNWKTWVGGTH
ncbi:unnamed protein product [Phytophthora fragariaefolia]|uniref:Unnamed protein product n=1 Tax=Phytophthora fragariaefolia TaxID=1490495 RepID=A0A9W6U5D9_9STRA|nr:unnamed protein product [Phytophthora fragariaefolia]